MNYQKLNNLLGWLVFAIATYTYVSTLEPTASFWDCGEYIATSYRLEVGHPPGAPTFLLVGRLFSMFVQPENVAYMVNLLSGLTSAFTILFLFWTITAMAKKVLGYQKDSDDFSTGDMLAILGSGIVGALAYTFSDTFWFSAVEGEVYAMSSMMTAITFWAILKWEQIAEEPKADRWIILIAYLIGLSIGIHLLNLLAIPAVALVIYFKKYKPTWKGMAAAAGIGVVTLALVQNVIIPQLVNMAAKFEYAVINSTGAPFHTGSILFMVLLMGAIVYGISYTIKKHKPIFNTILLSLLVLIIGYSSFILIMVRSNANTPIDENNPENLVNLLSYLNREQYGDVPLGYGQYFNSPLDNQEPYLDGEPVYYPDDRTGKYELADDRKNSIPNYAPEFKSIFPRMWSSKGNHVSAYKQWSDFKGVPHTYRTINGKTETINKPTMGENLKFFFSYQVGWMYFRYFLWNFAGRQNDTQGHGNFLDGNWMTGIRFIDDANVGNQDALPEAAINQKARNFFFAIPLILGLIGMFFQFKNDSNNAIVVMLLFLFTGLAIVVYLNQYPYQPRERDYAYAGSFYAFAIWIGFGVLALYDAAKNLTSKDLMQTIALTGGGSLAILLVGMLIGGSGNQSFTNLMIYMALVSSGLLALMFIIGQIIKDRKLQAVLATVLSLAGPILMAKDGWDDHDRSNRYTAKAIAKNYLDSCAPNAILFTNGDNDTFPLWYLQEVEGYRTDVRIVNLTLASTEWFIDMIKRQAYDGQPVPLSMEKDQYRQGTRDYLPIVERNKSQAYYDVSQVMEFILDDSKAEQFSNNQKMNYFPTRRFRVPVDSATVVANGTVSPDRVDRIVDAIQWEIKGNYVMKSEMVILDILAHNNWERPIYFANTMPRSSYFGLDAYMQHEGFAYRLVPVLAIDDRNQFGYFGEVESDVMYENMMEKFEFGNMEDPTIFLDENNLRFVTNLRLNFSRLANKLFTEGDAERAKAVLDKCVATTVNANTPHDITLIQVCELYFKLGDIESGTAVSKLLAKYYNDQIVYFSTLSKTETSQVTREIQQSIAVLQQLKAYAEQNNADELKEYVTPMFENAEAQISNML